MGARPVSTQSEKCSSSGANWSFFAKVRDFFFGPFAIDPVTGAQEAHTMLVTQWQRGVKRIVWPKEVADGQLVLAKESHD